jgi:ABC-type multidrug transport system ATPase subunit
LAVSDQAVSLDLIALYKALGGGWETLTRRAGEGASTAHRHDDARFLSGIAPGRRQQVLSPRDRRIGAGARQHFFSVGQGGLAALVGPDGAGKTTLIRLLAGLMKADGGTVSVLGIDAAKDPQAIQSRISYMPQQFGLYDDLTVLENLDLYADLHGVTAEEKRTQYARLMEMTGLDPFQKRLAGKLSGGMKQKLGLACTLVRSPELLLLDEPTVGVDPLSRRELWEIIRKLVKEGMTVLISSSFLDEAEACESVLVLNEGKKLAEGPPAEVSSWRWAAPSSPNRRTE